MSAWVRVPLTWEYVDCLDLHELRGEDTLKVKGTSRTGQGAAGWSTGLAVAASGTGTVAHAGVVLPRLLADRLGLTSELSGTLARAGFVPGRDRGRVLVDTACAVAAGASCLADVEAMTRQVEIFGPGGGASDTTVLRVLDEFAGHLGGSGLPGRRLASATAKVRARAWAAVLARHGGLPAVRAGGADLARPAVAPGQPGVPVVVIRLDAMIIFAADRKQGAEPNFKGCGFHPLTAWCSNTGEALAVMQRPGSAGSFTAADHLGVLDAAIGQIPASWRKDLLVTVFGAGASHEVINHLSVLNTGAAHGRRGRRVEYSIGWPVDERTRAALDKAPEAHWTPGLTAAGDADEQGQVLELTGLLRSSVGGDLLATWPADMRVIARRVPRLVGEQAQLGADPNWRYGAFVTNTPTGQLQFLDARHRTQAHVEDRIKELKACGAQRLPSASYARNSACLQLAALGVTLLAWLRLTALDGDLAKAEPKMLRFRLFAAPARYVRHARTRTLKISNTWPWARDLAAAWALLQALHPA